MIETVESQSGEIVSLNEVKRELGIWDSADDARARSRMEAARAYCEGWGEITLRLETVRTVRCESWPPGGFVLKHPPVTAVGSITYYDAEGVSQTLDTGSYRSHITAAGFGVVEWVNGFARPALQDRRDAVTVTYTTGWSTQEAAPEDLKAAILLTAKHLEGEDDTKSLYYAKRAAMQLLTGRSAWTYA